MARGAAAKSSPAPGSTLSSRATPARKIARANGCTLAELTEVNPGVNWSHLKVGQKIKLPEKKPAA